MSDFSHSEDGLKDVPPAVMARYVAQKQQMQQYHGDVAMGRSVPITAPPVLPCPRFREDTNEEGYWL